MANKIKILSSHIMTAQDFININTKDKYKFKGHSFVLLKGVGKQYCYRCGLVALKNKLTEWCIKKGCNYKDVFEYKNTIKRLSK